MKRPKFTQAQKYKMLISRETLFGIRLTGIIETICMGYIM